MKQIISGLLIVLLYSSMLAPLAITTNAQVIGRTRNIKMEQTESGLKFRLSEGVEGAETRVVPEPAAADMLSTAAAGKLLNRLSAIKSDPDDKAEFAKRIGTLPAPKAGDKLPVKFPADEQIDPPDAVSGQTLEVIRFSPEGEVPLAPDLSITFSQPMVAVTSQDEAAKYAPVELTPAVEGNWRWLGTRTLMFDTEKRFPMATKFTARVPAGTKAADGQTLAKDHVWTFTTPPPKVEQMIPQGQTVRRNAVMFIRFDQAIDQAAVLSSIRVRGGGTTVQTRLATDAEIDEAGLRYYVNDAQPGRWLAFRAIDTNGGTENALPANSPVNVTVVKGTPSAEGPLTTTADQSFSFRTFGPMKFVDSFCGWQGNNGCAPSTNFVMRFSNTIEASAFDKSLVKITPAVEGLNIYPSGGNLYIEGYKKGNTKYTVTVDEALKDIFGQTLGRSAVASFNVGTEQANLFAQGGAMVVLDPLAGSNFSVYSVNMNSVRVALYKVEPKDFQQFLEYRARLNYDDDKKPVIPGRKVLDKLVNIEKVSDELIETRVDLSSALGGGIGNVIVDIQPVSPIGNKNTRRYDPRVFVWAQSTKIGLDAFVDSAELVGWATDLQTGKPLSGVKLSIHPDQKLVSGQVAENVPEGSGMIARAWNWLTGWGSSQTGVESFDADGGAVTTEQIEPAQTNVTGANGLLRLPLPDSSAADSMNLLIAERGNDTAFLPENSDYYWSRSSQWYKRPEFDTLRWFVFDDRKMYKPNEEVAVKGYIRVIEGGKLGDLAELGDAASGITYSVKDARNNEITKGTAELNAFGAFDLRFKLQDNANLGYWRVDIQTSSSLHGSSHSHQFQVQEFRRPEFEVKAKVDSEAPHFVGGSANLSVDAKYYAGGGLANAETTWTVSAMPTVYTPPNRSDYTFGSWVPWWRVFDYYGGRPGGSSSTQVFNGVTDADGTHHLKIDFESVNPPRPYSVTASAAVQDVNRQTWAGSTSLLVHPADLYIGIRTPRTFVQKGQNIVVESIVSDIDGKLIAGRNAEIKAVLKDWVFEKGSWIEKNIDEQFCTITSTEDPQKCTFVAKQGGRYIITAVVMDDRERFNESELTVWVPGGKTPPSRNVEQEEVQIIPSQKDFKPGDTAELLVISPFTPAEGVLTLRRNGIVKTERFTMKDSSITLKIPLEKAYLPNIYAQVDLVGSAPRVDDKGEVDEKLGNRPAFATGNINLSISTDSRKLTVLAEPREATLAPGGETKVDVQVTGADGEPVANSEVAVVIVDESVLALTGYRVPDPMSIFYTDRASGTTDYHLRKDILLGNPEDVKSPPPAPPPGTMVSERAAAPSVRNDKSKAGFSIDGAAGAENTFVVDGQEVTNFRTGALNEDGTPITTRSNFDALAVFAPSVRTDANGKAVVDIKLPDNLTRYRITAVAVEPGKRFGKTESNITARQPLMVRPSAPRFLNFGDKFELPVIVQNQTDKDMTVDVAVRTSNAKLTDAAGGTPAVQSLGKRVVVKANSREEIRFPVATDKAGTARFQIAATSGPHSDAAEISLPVWTPATTEAFATYGTTDKNGAIFQPVQTPGDVYPQFGGLEVTTSSTQLQELTDSFIYLYRYPFECSEQVASRMISVAALKDVLSAFKAKDMPTEAEIKASFDRDIKMLQARQRNDGSFGMWKRDGERYTYPFLTVHVTHALLLAKAKGYRVPDEMLKRSTPYLKDIEKHYPNWYSAQTRWTISAYALYVRDLMGDKDAGKTKKLLAEATVEKMPFEALGWILSVLADDKNSVTEVSSIVRFLMNRTAETASTANFVTSYADDAWVIMHSNRRADGVLLEALIKAQPANDLIPKLVRGLLAHRKKGHWGSTQDNVFILLALDRYFKAFESVTPDFVTKVWLGNVYAGEQKFEGRSIDSNFLSIPMSYLVDQGGTSNLILDKQGAGRLYYRIGMTYAPKSLKLEPADHGFTVLRKYEAVDDPSEVRQNADGSWTFKAGARVRVRLTMVAQARRYHVALVDQLPAGLEILNPGLAVTEAIPVDTGEGNTGVIEMSSRSYGGSWWWRQNWFEHQNFRDERAEAFSSLLWAGVYNYTYVTRATTPGEFIVPPAKAEEMYAPETFGRTGTDRVTIE